MEEKEFMIEGYDYQFRIKKMNAIEALALQTQIDFSTMENSKNLILTSLEYMEVKAQDKWVPVKLKKQNVFVPDCLENDIVLLKGLIDYFSENYLKGLFQKSDESK